MCVISKWAYFTVFSLKFLWMGFDFLYIFFMLVKYDQTEQNLGIFFEEVKMGSVNGKNTR